MAEVQERVRVAGVTAGVAAGAVVDTAIADVSHGLTAEMTLPVEVAFPQAVITKAAPRSKFPQSKTSGFAKQVLNWSAPSPVAGSVALKSEAALAQVWAEHQGLEAELPQVDFEQSMVLAVFAGEGFFREVPSIERVKVLANEVVVYVSRFSRPWSKHNAKAVVQVPASALPVRFVYLS